MKTLFGRKGFEIAGWVIFVASAALFTASGVRSGDTLSTAGSVLFLGACFMFLAPLVRDKR